MALDRYNAQAQRLKKFQRLSNQVGSKMTSKKHREMQLLRASIDIYNEEYSIDKMKSIVNHIESLREINRATISDLARLEILKEKLFNK